MPQTSASRPSQRSKGQKPRPSADEEPVRAIYGSARRRYFPRPSSKTGPTKRWITAIARGMFWPSSMLNLIPLSQDKAHHQCIDERHESAHRTPGNVRAPAHCQFHSPGAHLRSLSSGGSNHLVWLRVFERHAADVKNLGMCAFHNLSYGSVESNSGGVLLVGSCRCLQ